MDTNIKFWDKASKFYTFFQEKSNKKLFLELSELIKNHLTKDMKVLELACGTGQITTHLASEVDLYIATDFSKKMIEKAKDRDILNVNFEVQDATNLTYEDESFDCVIIANALHIMPDPSKALNEIKRVLKPTGLLIAPTFTYDGKINKFKLWFTKKMGFKTYHEWNNKEFTKYILDHDFDVLENVILEADPVSETFLVAIK